MTAKVSYRFEVQITTDEYLIPYSECWITKDIEHGICGPHTEAKNCVPSPDEWVRLAHGFGYLLGPVISMRNNAVTFSCFPLVVGYVPFSVGEQQLITSPSDLIASLSIARPQTGEEW